MQETNQNRTDLLLEMVAPFSEEEPIPRKLLWAAVSLMGERHIDYTDFAGEYGRREYIHSLAHLATNQYLESQPGGYWVTEGGHERLAQISNTEQDLAESSS